MTPLGTTYKKPAQSKLKQIFEKLNEVTILPPPVLAAGTHSRIFFFLLFIHF